MIYLNYTDYLNNKDNDIKTYIKKYSASEKDFFYDLKKEYQRIDFEKRTFKVYGSKSPDYNLTISQVIIIVDQIKFTLADEELTEIISVNAPESGKLADFSHFFNKLEITPADYKLLLEIAESKTDFFTSTKIAYRNIFEIDETNEIENDNYSDLVEPKGKEGKFILDQKQTSALASLFQDLFYKYSKPSNTRLSIIFNYLSGFSDNTLSDDIGKFNNKNTKLTGAQKKELKEILEKMINRIETKY